MRTDSGASRLSRGCLRLFSVTLLASASAAPPAPSPSPNHGPQTYDSFRLVHNRNVFDPDRRPPRAAGSTVAAAPTTRADYVALTGTAVDHDQAFAFFSGSRAEFNKVLSATGNIAGATVTKITPVNIEVQRGTRHLVVEIGQTVPLDDKSTPAPAPADQPDSVAPAPTATPAAGVMASVASPRTGSTGAAATSIPPANLDEIRRRMMERHAQDQK